MSRLLKADFYHLRKSRLTLIALILAVAFPVLIVLLYAGLDALTGDGGNMLFTLVVITVYALVTVALALVFFPFNWDTTMDLALEIVYFVSYGLMTFAFIATVSTMFALIFRSVAPTIILTIVFSLVLFMVNSILMAVDYESFKHVVYFIPTFGENIFNLNSLSVLSLIHGITDTTRTLIFAEGMLSYLFFGALHTLIGLFFFKKRDLK